MPAPSSPSTDERQQAYQEAAAARQRGRDARWADQVEEAREALEAVQEREPALSGRGLEALEMLCRELRPDERPGVTLYGGTLAVSIVLLLAPQRLQPTVGGALCGYTGEDRNERSRGARLLLYRRPAVMQRLLSFSGLQLEEAEERIAFR